MPNAVVAKIRQETMAKFPTVTDLGTDNCRRKRPPGDPSEWSEHAYGNAWDAGVPDLATGDKVKAWLLANKTRLSVGTILWRVENHFDHLHIQGARIGFRIGPPACADPLSSPAGVSGAIPNFGVQGDPRAPGPENVHGITALEGTSVSVGDVIAAVFDPETYARVLWFMLGAAASIGAVVVLAKDLLGVDLASQMTKALKGT